MQTNGESGNSQSWNLLKCYFSSLRYSPTFIILLCFFLSLSICCASIFFICLMLCTFDAAVCIYLYGFCAVVFVCRCVRWLAIVYRLSNVTIMSEITVWLPFKEQKKTRKTIPGATDTMDNTYNARIVCVVLPCKFWCFRAPSVDSVLLATPSHFLVANHKEENVTIMLFVKTFKCFLPVFRKSHFFPVYLLCLFVHHLIHNKNLLIRNRQKEQTQKKNRNQTFVVVFELKMGQNAHKPFKMKNKTFDLLRVFISVNAKYLGFGACIFW